MNSTLEKVLAAGESLFLLNIATAIRVNRAKRMGDQMELKSIQGNLDRTGDARRMMAFYGTAAAIVLALAFGSPLGVGAALLYSFVQIAAHAYARQTVDSAVSRES